MKKTLRNTQDTLEDLMQDITKEMDLTIDVEIFINAVGELGEINNADITLRLEQYTNWYAKYCTDFVMTESGRYTLESISKKKITTKNDASAFLLLYSVNATENWDISIYDSYMRQLQKISSKFSITEKLEKDTVSDCIDASLIAQNPNYIMLLDMLHAMTCSNPGRTDFSEEGRHMLLQSIEEFAESI